MLIPGIAHGTKDPPIVAYVVPYAYAVVLLMCWGVLRLTRHRGILERAAPPR